MRRVLYLSHATPEMYAILRGGVPSGFELVTLESDRDDERKRRGARDALTTKFRAIFANIDRFYRGAPLLNEVLDR